MLFLTTPRSTSSLCTNTSHNSQMEADHTNGTSGRRFHLVAVPYPGRGHINPMLNLCCHLAAKHILVTLVVTEEWVTILSEASLSFPSNLRLRSIPNILPSERTRGADMFGFLHDVLTKMGKQVEELLSQLEPAFDAVIADSFLPWAAGIGTKMRVPVSMLFTQSATMFLGFHLLSRHGAGGGPCDLANGVSGKEKEFLEYIPTPSSIQVSGESFSSVKILAKKFNEIVSWSSKAQGLLFSSIYELEPHAVDILRLKFQQPVYCLGNSIPSMELNKDTTTSCYLEWLDSQQRSSVLYVSLGSYLNISTVEMQEMLHGLHASGFRFLLVARGMTISDEETNRELGLVVQWCDQLRVLSHPSVGGFLTHCGWNSSLEAAYAGVPMLTFPLMWDQMPNSKLIVDKWKVGFRLKSEGKEQDMVGRQEIAEAVKKLMNMEDDESKEVRRRAAELKEKCEKALESGGSATTGFVTFVNGVLQGPKIINEATKLSFK